LEIKIISKKIVFSGKTEKRNILLAGDKINSYLNKINNKAIMNLPVKLPMICKPKKYLNDDGSISLGGFLLNDELYVESLIIDKMNLAYKSSLSKDNIIYNLVDNINSVPFSINQEVLDFITKYNKTFDLIIDTEYTHPLELKSKLTLVEKKELESFKSKQNLEFEILNLAHIFRNSPELYIPIRLDYRGRIYCNVEYLHYQSVELAKSLLQFAKGEVVYLNDEVSINFLKIFGANCFGNTLNKTSFNDRIH
jgi:DNA-directed RNA polymerase, mitochondrial